MSAVEVERSVHGVTIRIDGTLCVSFGDCVEAAPEAFRLATEGIVEFLAPETADRTRLLEACEACPVDAITVIDAEGRQIVP